MRRRLGSWAGRTSRPTRNPPKGGFFVALMETPTIENAGAKGAWRARRSGCLGAGRASILGMLHLHGDEAVGLAGLAA